MTTVLPLKGEVKFPLHIDPTVWIFDDRKFDLDQWHPEINEDNEDAQETYLKQVSSQWDKELIEGSAPPPKEPIKRTKKEILTETTFGIPFKPFILNSEPNENAASLIVHTKTEDFEYPMDQALELMIGFSLKGKPININEGGPIYIYHGDGSNRSNPIKNVTGFTIK